MASAYRSLADLSSDSDSDGDSVAFDHLMSDYSNSIVHDDFPRVSEDSKSTIAVPKQFALPPELRSRILMLTSRGVSYR